jgi:hypothetical protein
MTSTASTEDAMVHLNVGGHRYDVPRSLFELYPRSMLARLVSDEWSTKNEINNNDDDSSDYHEDDEIIFIDRNGHRFQYVLDYMRDREVNLPMSESIEATRKELEYYGLDGVRGEETTSPSITLGSPAEARRIMAIMGGNKLEELESLDKTIRECETTKTGCENRKHAIKLAHSLFEHSVAHSGDDAGPGHRCTIRIREKDERSTCPDVLKEEEFFRAKLRSYGLELVNYKIPRYMYSEDEPCQFVLEFKNISDNTVMTPSGVPNASHNESPSGSLHPCSDPSYSLVQFALDDDYRALMIFGAFTIYCLGAIATICIVR